MINSLIQNIILGIVNYSVTKIIRISNGIEKLAHCHTECYKREQNNNQNHSLNLSKPLLQTRLRDSHSKSTNLLKKYRAYSFLVSCQYQSLSLFCLFLVFFLPAFPLCTCSVLLLLLGYMTIEISHSSFHASQHPILFCYEILLFIS